MDSAKQILEKAGGGTGIHKIMLHCRLVLVALTLPWPYARTSRANKTLAEPMSPVSPNVAQRAT